MLFQHYYDYYYYDYYHYHFVLSPPSKPLTETGKGNGKKKKHERYTHNHRNEPNLSEKVKKSEQFVGNAPRPPRNLAENGKKMSNPPLPPE